jgi:hypothetical protein
MLIDSCGFLDRHSCHSHVEPIKQRRAQKTRRLLCPAPPTSVATVQLVASCDFPSCPFRLAKLYRPRISAMTSGVCLAKASRSGKGRAGDRKPSLIWFRRNIQRSMARWRREIWSRGRELNSRPADYESAALPLSYLGFEALRLAICDVRHFSIVHFSSILCQTIPNTPENC